MPKKSTSKRTFGEWFFGEEKSKQAKKPKTESKAKHSPKQTKKKTKGKKNTSTKKSPANKKGTTKKVVAKKKTSAKQEDVKNYIAETIDRLPSELGAKEAEQEVATLSPELARKHEQLKRKHLKIGVIAFSALIGIIWFWNMVVSMSQFATASSDSFEAWQKRAGEINQQVSQTFDEQTK